MIMEQLDIHTQTIKQVTKQTNKKTTETGPSHFTHM